MDLSISILVSNLNSHENNDNKLSSILFIIKNLLVLKQGLDSCEVTPNIKNGKLLYSNVTATLDYFQPWKTSLTLDPMYHHYSSGNCKLDVFIQKAWKDFMGIVQTELNLASNSKDVQTMMIHIKATLPNIIKTLKNFINENETLDKLWTAIYINIQNTIIASFGDDHFTKEIDEELCHLWSSPAVNEQ